MQERAVKDNRLCEDTRGNISREDVKALMAIRHDRPASRGLSSATGDVIYNSSALIAADLQQVDQTRREILSMKLAV